MTIRLMIIDDHDLVRAGLIQYLEAQPDIEVVAEAANGKELLQKLHAISADLLLLDITMPGISGVYLITVIKTFYPGLRILILSMHYEVQMVFSAMKAGASGYISKNCSPPTLLDAVKKVMATGEYITQDMAEKLACAAVSAQPDNDDTESQKRRNQVNQIVLGIQNEQLWQAQIELEKSRNRYVDFYDFAPVGYLTLNHDGLIDEINLTGAAMFEVERNKITQQRFTNFIAPAHHDLWHCHLMNALKHDGVLACELALQHADGSSFFAQLNCLSLMKDSKEPMVRIVLTDITERKRVEEQFHDMAFHDALTQLPNRRLLNDRLEQTFAASKRSGRYGALMFLDMDNFKSLNDMYGHEVGDLFLIEVARRISGCVREMDTVSRFGGDEFVVLLGELDVDKAKSAAQACIVAEKIRATLAEPFVLERKQGVKAEITVEHHCSSSIGVVLFINHEASIEDIIKCADMAMYQAKSAGCNLIRFYDY